MKYGIYYAYWEKQWGADYLKYVKKVKDQGFDILEISCAGLKDMPKEARNNPFGFDNIAFLS